MITTIGVSLLAFIIGWLLSRLDSHHLHNPIPQLFTKNISGTTFMEKTVVPRQPPHAVVMQEEELKTPEEIAKEREESITLEPLP